MGTTVHMQNCFHLKADNYSHSESLQEPAHNSSLSCCPTSSFSIQTCSRIERCVVKILKILKFHSPSPKDAVSSSLNKKEKHLFLIYVIKSNSIEAKRVANSCQVSVRLVEKRRIYIKKKITQDFL